MSGGKPRPRNDSVDSAMMAPATLMVPATITGPSAFGRMWRHTTRVVVAPSARAPPPHDLLLAKRKELRAHQPRHLHPAEAADHQHDQHEHAALGPEDGLQRLPGTGDN